MATGGEKPQTGHPAATEDATNHNDKEKKTAPSSSSSSSSESSWGEPVESTAPAANTNKSSPQAVVSSTSHLRSASEGALYTTDDRSPTDRAEDPEAYRIPSQVFSKSSTPMDWSTASNESLFSIQMGNMSFTKDQGFLLGKSDELGFDPPPSMGLSPMSSPLRDRPPIISSSPAKTSATGSPKPAETTSPLPPSNQNHHGITAAVEDDEKSGRGGGGSGSSSGESRADQTVHEVNKRTEGGGGGNIEAGSAAVDASGGTGAHPTQVVQDPSFHSASLRRSSTASGTSVKSFAFPILTGNGQHRPTQSQSQPPTPQAAQQDVVTPRSSVEDNAHKRSNSKSSTSRSRENKGKQGGQSSKWFSCFPCCPSRTS